MPIVRKTRTKSFTVINNTVLERKDLSLKAKGLWAFVMTKPDGWQTSVHGLTAQLQEGEASIRAALKELENAGLYSKRRVFDKNNRINWLDEMFDEPHGGFPHVGNPVVEDPVVGNRTQVNTELVRTEQVNTDTTNVVEQAHGNEEINTLIKGFEEAFGIEQPKAERRAAQWLRRKYKDINMIVGLFQKVAHAQQRDKFCPVTPTVSKFWYKIPELQAYFKRQESTNKLIDFNF